MKLGTDTIQRVRITQKHYDMNHRESLSLQGSEQFLKRTHQTLSQVSTYEPRLGKLSFRPIETSTSDSLQ